MACFKLLCIILLLSPINAEDFYELLGVERNADNRDIRRAFKKLALTMHPDKNPGNKDAHDKFVRINRAYEVLRDEEMRKKYDVQGEAGLEDDVGRGHYQSWRYYSESFGIYDDDPEVITLSRSDFDQSVIGSPDVWFINFYSPQCSHCHHLAPAWREMARELEGVVRIGAVNCEEDWMLCRQQNIHSYPSLLLYPGKERYRGSREVEDMVNYVMTSLPNKVIELSARDLPIIMSGEEYKSKPWLITVCQEDECIGSEVSKKLGIILDGLVSVGKVDIRKSKKICDMLDCTTTVSYYQNVTLLSKDTKGHEIDMDEAKNMANQVLKLLPSVKPVTDTMFEKIREELQSAQTQPWLIDFVKDMAPTDFSDGTELKRLSAFLPNVRIGYIDCGIYPQLCSFWFVQKFPKFILFKPGGTYEIHHGRFTAHDIAAFVRESLSSKVRTLTPSDFPTVTKSKKPWFIDFFAPWCPPCMQLLPEWRRVSRSVGHLVNFGTVDCTMHDQLCNKYSIRSYPTAILFNHSSPHMFTGSYNQHQLKEFIEDVLHPRVIELTSGTFNEVRQKPEDIIWVIDFYAPWCTPCQQMMPEWRKLGKLLKDDKNIRVGAINCETEKRLCSELDVRGFPAVRLYPLLSKGISKFHFYHAWQRDASSFHAWVYGFLPSKVAFLNKDDFEMILTDSHPWLVNFYAGWCGHCHTFAPEFEKVAKALEGKAKAGKMNCEQFAKICNRAGVRAYPTVILYEGARGKGKQSSVGEEIHHLNYESMVSIVENRLSDKPELSSHDEL